MRGRVNGCGKTVLAKLIAGQMLPTAGEVLIDGRSPRSYPAEMMERQLAFIPQQEILFRGTIIENISLFREDLRDASAGIARAMGLAEAVSSLPNGYRTLVGDGAQEFLPRGIVQQITIVRSLASGPKIILFDDANSALDDAGDRALRTVLGNLKGRSTVLLISQRPSILRLADRVFELHQGRMTLKPGPVANPPPSPAG
ncbi:hypothetical protein WCLP8_4690017 [uncultured Gammaproteobacteria bacterium]